MTAAIEAEGLVKSYGKGAAAVPALSGVGFSVGTGAVAGLLGPNGAGKSTTVKILSTLARPDAGRATVAGFDVLRRPADVRRAIGHVSQRPGFDPVGTGRENLVLQGRIHGLTGRAAGRRADELLERFGLAEAGRRRAGTWSGGMQRKLDVALGLVHRPQVLFLDEPTTGLDPEARAELWSEVSRLTRDDGLTVLLTTHYLDEADRLAGTLVIVDRGRVVAEGTPDELKSGLGGDTVSLGLADPATVPAARAALERLAGVHGVTAEGGTLRARVTSGPSLLPAALAALARAGAEPVAVATARPSLDEVYLHHAGRAFQGADAAEAA